MSTVNVDSEIFVMRVLHLLEMSIKEIIQLVPRIAEAGFTHIQIGNVCPLKSKMYPNELNKKYGYPYKRNRYSDWWKLYQPLRFEIGNEEIGSKGDLIELCKVADKYNIKIVIDFVPRHLASSERRYEDMVPNKNCDPEILAREDSFLYRIPMKYGDRFSEIWHCNKLPSLNYTSEFIISKYTTFLKEIVNCGVKGIRIDMAKHIALPSEGGKLFWEMIKYFKEEYKLDIYGESIQCGDDILNKILDETNIMVLTDYIGYNRSDRTVKFIYSHDIALTDEMDIENEKVIEGYCKICENNPNTLFYTMDYKDWDDPRVAQANKIRF